MTQNKYLYIMRKEKVILSAKYAPFELKKQQQMTSLLFPDWAMTFGAKYIHSSLDRLR